MKGRVVQRIARSVASAWGIGVAFLFTLTVGGCAERRATSFPLTILTTMPLGEAPDAVFPESFLGLNAPLHAEGCPTVFVPQLSILRLDIPGAKPIPIRPRSERGVVGWVWKFWGMNPAANEDLAKKNAEAMARQPIGVALCSPGSANADVAGSLYRFMATRAERRYFVLGADAGAISSALSTRGHAVFADDLKTLTDKIATSLCEGASRMRAVECVVLLEGGEGSLPTPPPDSIRLVRAGDGPSSDVVARDAEARYRQLAMLVQTARGQERKQVEKTLDSLERRFGTDYRFHYLHASLLVYGKGEHHEAFHHLFRAAEIAIVNGDAIQMKSALPRDSHEDAVFHPLSHGHDEWHTMLNALSERNVGPVKV